MISAPTPTPPPGEGLWDVEMWGHPTPRYGLTWNCDLTTQEGMDRHPSFYRGRYELVYVDVCRFAVNVNVACPIFSVRVYIHVSVHGHFTCPIIPGKMGRQGKDYVA